MNSRISNSPPTNADHLTSKLVLYHPSNHNNMKTSITVEHASVNQWKQMMNKVICSFDDDHQKGVSDLISFIDSHLLPSYKKNNKPFMIQRVKDISKNFLPSVPEDYRGPLFIFIIMHTQFSLHENNVQPNGPDMYKSPISCRRSGMRTANGQSNLPDDNRVG